MPRINEPEIWGAYMQSREASKEIIKEDHEEYPDHIKNMTIGQFLDLTKGTDEELYLRIEDYLNNLLANELSDTNAEDKMSDVEADADTLASAGMGTDEDYGYYGDDDV
jgi:hypothetical protein